MVSHSANPLVRITLFTSLIAIMPPALAQDDREEIEEVVVTAQKRSQSLQDVSSSVTALDEDQLRLGGIEDITRLEHLVPGLRFGQSGHEARLAMRGTRTNNVGTEAEQVVGIFEDGVYIPTTTQALGAYVDLARIEVLRGPQGTLYGRNTFGGTINIITNEPSFDGFEYSLSGLYGDYARSRFEGMLNLPLGDAFAIRLAGFTDDHDGYIINTNESGTSDDLNDKNLEYLRITAKWRPNERFDATLRIADSSSHGNGSAIWGYQQIGGYVSGQLRPGHQYAPSDASGNFDQGPWRVSRNLKSLADIDSLSATLTLNLDLEFATLKVVANTNDFEGTQQYDSDYSDGGDPLNNGFTGWDSEQTTHSAEMQLISNGDGPLEWLVGYYYYEQTANWNWNILANGEFVEPNWDRQGDYVSDSIGIFGHASYALNERTRLIVGLRYAEDSKRQRDILDYSTFPPTISAAGSEGDWDKTLWKLGVEYDFTANTMGYAVASTGYRAGGINFVAPRVPLTYDSEAVTAYEAGLKNTLQDGRLTLNFAAYVNAYRDLQAQSFIFLGGGGVTEFTENGGEVDAMGLEVELRWLPAPHWEITANAAFTDATFGDYGISSLAGLGSAEGRQNLNDPNRPLLSLKGWSPALSPEFSVGLQIGRDFQLGDRGVLTPFVQTTYTGEYWAADANLEGTEQPAHSKSDLRLIWTSADSRLQAQVFVLNVEDEAVLNRVVVFNPGGTSNLASLQAHWNNPRTWGASVTYSFF